MSTKPPVSVPFDVEHEECARVRVIAADGREYIARLAVAVQSVIDTQQVAADGTPLLTINVVSVLHVSRADAQADAAAKFATVSPEERAAAVVAALPGGAQNHDPSSRLN